jgi:hypothetical protein
MPEGVGGFTEVFKNRMVIPFTGSYEDFRHVLHHELTHAVMFNLLYGNDISSLMAAGDFQSAVVARGRVRRVFIEKRLGL